MFNSHFICAFPFIPIENNKIDEASFGRIIDSLKAVEMPFICAGATDGSIVRLTIDERVRLIELIREHAPDSELMVDVSSFRADDILLLAKEAVNNDANALMLSPMSFETLQDDECIHLFENLNSKFNMPVCVNGNNYSGIRFSDKLYQKLSAVSAVKSICLPNISQDPNDAQNQIKELKDSLPSKITIGFSDDTAACNALISGCELWYSALAGVLPKTCIKIALSAVTGNQSSAMGQFCQLSAIMEIMKKNGSSKTIAALLRLRGIIDHNCLPEPLRELNEADNEMLKAIVSTFNFE